MAREYYVYIMTNRSGTLYTGVTNNLIARVDEPSKGCSPNLHRTVQARPARVLRIDYGRHSGNSS